MPIAIILPPKEMFSPRATGAIGLLVHGLARALPGAVVYGMATQQPFGDVAFTSVPLPWWPLRQVDRYALGLVRALRRARPALIEVHNRPDLALHLATRFPAVPVVLFLHNDPQGMRRARTAAERVDLVARLARVRIAAKNWKKANARVSRSNPRRTTLKACGLRRIIP